jgi:hypothetical protein
LADPENIVESLDRTQDDLGPHAFTIAEFCGRQQISVASYYYLKKRGLGPIEMRAGKTLRISPDAEAA